MVAPRNSVKARVVMLLHKDVKHDGRVQREAVALAGTGYDVAIVHFARSASIQASPGSSSYRLISASIWKRRRPRFRVLQRMVEAFGMTLRAIATRPRIVIAHDVAMLPPAFVVSRVTGAKLVYDSHELATGVPYRSGLWARLVETIERRLVPDCDVVLTVSEGIASRIRALYGLPKDPVVIRNLPDLPPPEQSAAPDIRKDLQVGDRLLVLHQGAVADGRGGPVLLDAIARLGAAQLLFVGTEGPFAEHLETRAEEMGIDDRVHFRPPVPLEELLSHTAQADVGVSLLEDTCENHRLALPNKVFEYLAAGLPVVASDLPELRRLAIDHPGRIFLADPGDAASVASAIELAAQAPGESGRAPGLEWATERQRLVDAVSGLAS